jgi:putative peptidoglycan lipid II flippase
VWGIPLATSIANVVGTIVLFALLRRRVGRIELGQTLSALARIVLASAGLAAASYGVWRVLDDALGRSLLDQIVSLGTALAAGLVVYLAACRALRVHEMQAVLSLRGRLKRA